MPIGATIGAAALTAGGSVLASSSQKKAAKQAATIAQDDNTANRAFLTDIYHQNEAHLAPWETQGRTAGNAIMELLGLSQPAPAAPAAFSAGSYGPASFSQPAYPGDGPRFLPNGEPEFDLGYRGGGFGGMQYVPPDPGAAPATAPGAVTTSAPSAFDTYRNSTGYQFRFDQGVNALQKAFGRNLESGAASKAAIKYGQGIGSDEFSRYMQLLQGQQNLGFGASSALVGVGQNFGNNVVAGNTNAADAAANARLYAGQANANMWQGIGSSFGQVAGQVFGSGGRGAFPAFRLPNVINM
jgi:hypothetical protein